MASEKPSKMGVSPLPSPIEIVYFIDSLWGVGGAEMSLSRLVRALPKDRFRCRVVTFYADERGLALFKGSCEVHHWQMHNLYGPTAFSVARRIRELVRRESIEIAHTFFQVSDLWAGPIAKISGARHLISSRRDMGILRRRGHNLGYRVMRPFYDQVHTVSDSVRRYTMEQDHVPADKIVTVYNGVELDNAGPMSRAEKDRARAALGIGPGQIVVTTIANWRYVKGLDVLVRAAAIVAERAPHVRFLAVGKGGGNPADRAFTEEVELLSRSLGAERFMQFLGASDQVHDLLRLSDICVSPSRSEGLSNALLEAMGAGLPCVATAVGGSPEVVMEGVTGYLVPAEDAVRLADRILDLVADQSRERMGAAGRQRVIDNFSAQGMTSKVIQSYEQALAGQHQGAAPESRLVY